MASYKVSYKVLKQQGESMKAAAKLVDGYAERVSQISGKLGDDALLAEVRQNLGKLKTQLGESRTVLNTAGELLIKTVDSYTGTETRQVKKVDAYKAHNRDFYKKPIVVASAGAGAAVGAAAVGAAAGDPTVASTTVSYTDNSVNTVQYSAGDTPGGAASPDVQPMAASGVSAPAPATQQGGGAQAATAATLGALGGAAATVGAVAGVKAKKKHDAVAAEQKNQTADSYDPEVELQKAVQRLKDLDAPST